MVYISGTQKTFEGTVTSIVFQFIILVYLQTLGIIIFINVFDGFYMNY